MASVASAEVCEKGWPQKSAVELRTESRDICRRGQDDRDAHPGWSSVLLIIAESHTPASSRATSV